MVSGHQSKTYIPLHPRSKYKKVHPIYEMSWVKSNFYIGKGKETSQYSRVYDTQTRPKECDQVIR